MNVEGLKRLQVWERVRDHLLKMYKQVLHLFASVWRKTEPTTLYYLLSNL